MGVARRDHAGSAKSRRGSRRDKSSGGTTQTHPPSHITQYLHTTRPPSPSPVTRHHQRLAGNLVSSRAGTGTGTGTELVLSNPADAVGACTVHMWLARRCLIAWSILFGCCSFHPACLPCLPCLSFCRTFHVPFTTSQYINCELWAYVHTASTPYSMYSMS